MRYMGGKSRIAKALSEVIEATDGEYWEPFVGGFGSFEVIAPKFKVAHANDIHPDLMLMWDAVLNHGWEPPTEVSLEQYKELRHAEPSALRGFVGFGGSFGGKWFGGYAKGGFQKDGSPRNHQSESSRNVLKTRSRLTDVRVYTYNTSYDQLNPKPGDVVYCDPPYEDTARYDTYINHQTFWQWAQELSEQGVNVYVSSYQAPDGWVSIWSKELKSTVSQAYQRHTAQERLFVWRGVR